MNNAETTRQVGRLGERIAGVYLESLGYSVLRYNYYAVGGEIDLVAEDGHNLVFVEVKLRSDSPALKKYGRPATAVNPEKRRHIVTAVKSYLKEYNITGKCPRIDVIELITERLENGWYSVRIRHTKAAFGAEDKKRGTYESF